MNTAGWPSLVAHAALGTARGSVPPLAAASPLAIALAEAPAASPETTLLRIAAATQLYDRAGRVADLQTDPAPAPPTDETPEASVRSAAHLGALLDGDHPGVLAEWLLLTSAAGRRAPRAHLPRLLTLAAKVAPARPLILATLDATGRWLASQNPAWAALVAAPSPDALRPTWETGTLDERAAALTAVRRADPAAGRAMLQEVWTSEPREALARLLRALAVGLGPDDEPMLENALEARHAAVRGAGAALLARSPASAFVARVCEALGRTIMLSGRGATARIEVDADALRRLEGDKGRARLGIDEGEGALAKLAAAAPLSFWNSRGPRETWVALAKGGDFERSLVGGWVAATARERDVTWAETLVSFAWPPRGFDEAGWLGIYMAGWPWPVYAGGDIPLRALGPGTLVGLLDHAARERVVTRSLTATSSPAAPLIAQCDHPWSAEFSLAVARHYHAKLIGVRGVDLPTLRLTLLPLMPLLAARFHPAEAPAIDAALGPSAVDDAHWRPAAARLLATLAFRTEMRNEIER